MRPASRLLLAFLVGVALATGMVFIYGYWAALPMPWLRLLPKHAASCILLICDLCVGIVPAYVIGRQLFRYVSPVLWAAVFAGLPWVVLSIYYDYSAIRYLQLHPSFPSALQATLHSWLFLPGMLVTLLSVPAGLCLAFVTEHSSRDFR
jgi:hypothetical protein